MMDFPAFTAEDISPLTDSLPLPCLPGTTDSHLAFSSLLTAGQPGQSVDHRTWPPPEQAEHPRATWTSTPSSNTGPPSPRRRFSEPVAYTPYNFFGGAGTSSGLVYPAHDDFYPKPSSFPNGFPGICGSDNYDQGQEWRSSSGDYKRWGDSEQRAHETVFWPHASSNVTPSTELSASRPGEYPMHPLNTRLCDIQETDWPPLLLSGEAEVPLPTPPPRAPAAQPVSSWRSPRSHAQGLHLPIPPPMPTYQYVEAEEVEQVEQVTVSRGLELPSMGWSIENSRSDLQPFISKLCHLLQHKQYEPWIRWDSSGRYLLVAHTKPHLLVILEKFFRHTVISSFIRQLNVRSVFGTLRESSLSTTDANSPPYRSTVSVAPRRRFCSAFSSKPTTQRRRRCLTAPSRKRSPLPTSLLSTRRGSSARNQADYNADSARSSRSRKSGRRVNGPTAPRCWERRRE